MTDKTLRIIGDLLGAVPAAGSFAACRTGWAENLRLEVQGVGPIALPVTPAQARQLCEVARPARYGRREQTLLDRKVRDTWEVPRELVTIGEPRWRETLLPMVDTLRADLGLPPNCTLSAELHSMLVYEPGQFFRCHQDSEKADDMIGTLVVTLPSVFSGGELVIEQQGAAVTDRGSPEQLSFVAFYSDCEHEVFPVTDGFRVTLTYNLVARGRIGPASADFAAHPSVPVLAEQLRAHFTTPVELPIWPSRQEPAHRVPRQLVYPLDHQYSRHGFGWDRLKGSDAARTGMMLAAADSAECDTLLALTEVNECYKEEYTLWSMTQRERWERVEDGWKCIEYVEADYDEDGEMLECEPDDPASHPVRREIPLAPDSSDLEELRSSSITSTWLIDRSGAAGPPDVAEIREEELCTGELPSTLEPFAVAVEGYTGNEGNNAEFWYRRAAVIVRPGR
ncbi:MAG: 2OG-Fe(II) oxygenase [Nocardia sp.]|nr:2OG-Fe(II) oxygenase [Nocardia sp.]